MNTFKLYVGCLKIIDGDLKKITPASKSALKVKTLKNVIIKKTLFSDSFKDIQSHERYNMLCPIFGYIGIDPNTVLSYNCFVGNEKKNLSKKEIICKFNSTILEYENEEEYKVLKLFDYE